MPSKDLNVDMTAMRNDHIESGMCEEILCNLRIHLTHRRFLDKNLSTSTSMYCFDALHHILKFNNVAFTIHSCIATKFLRWGPRLKLPKMSSM